jgi:xylose isomerase
MLKIDSALTSFSACSDRFVRKGYRDAVELEKQLELAAQVQGLQGIAFDYPTQFADPIRTKALLQGYGFRAGMVEIDMYSEAKWKYGSLTAADPAVRREAMERVKQGIDFGAADVQLWLGQDGYEYPFQADYVRVWDRLADSLREAAEYRPDVKITVEYKAKEPRARCFIANAGTALALVNDVGLPNIGVTLDVGHSLMAKENPAEAAVLLSKYKRLFHLHINDNYRDWDHDMLPGTVNFWDTLEFFYWLRKVNFDGWFGIDIYPYREDGLKALSTTVRWIHRFYETAGTLDEQKLEQYRSADEPLEILSMLMDRFLQ